MDLTKFHEEQCSNGFKGGVQWEKKFLCSVFEVINISYEKKIYNFVSHSVKVELFQARIIYFWTDTSSCKRMNRHSHSRVVCSRTPVKTVSNVFADNGSRFDYLRALFAKRFTAEKCLVKNGVYFLETRCGRWLKISTGTC